MCQKTFNTLTGTPLAHLRHKSKWLDYLGATAESFTVRKATKTINVHRNTTFRWRHRFVSWIQQNRPNALHGITEADETYLLESHKGECVVVKFFRTIPWEHLLSNSFFLSHYRV